MGLVKGGFQRLLTTLLYFLAFCCSAIIIGIYSYFLAVQADRNAFISRDEKAIEGLSGAATLYTIFATVLTCCLGGITFFSFIGIVLDICFVGAMIAIAVMTRHGASSCRGYVYTPIGNGPSNVGLGFDNASGTSNEITYAVHYGTACRLNTACFAVSIVGAVLFFLTALMQIALARHHKKEKRFGPSPTNNYTSGYGKRKFWQRKPKNGATRDAEYGAAGGLAAPGVDTRPSHETGFTGSTVAGTGAAPYDKVEGTHAGYHTQPHGTAVNPYGYEAPAGTATNY